MKNILTASNDINHEYCCTVVKIGEIQPIIGSDFLGTTIVDGRTIVIRKDQVKEGDIMIYASNQSALSIEFLSITNQFSMDQRHLNSNYAEVEEKRNEITKLRKEGKTAEADVLELETKQMVGFFNQYGQVRMLKLRGVISMGYLISMKQFETFCPEIKDDDISKYIGKDFDTVNDKLFVHVFVPVTKEHHTGTGPLEPRKEFNRMIPGQFAFHYDTQGLHRDESIIRINPTDNVNISVKLHGTSFIMGNVKIKKPIIGWLYAKNFVKLPKFLQFTRKGYGEIYSSRKIIKNKYLTNRPEPDDVWTEYYHILKGHLDKGMTVYGEIVGYLTGSTKMIQKGYDYGCIIGNNKLMPYRITQMTENGLKEWNVSEVYDWTIKLMDKLGSNSVRILPINIVYTGTMANLYPDIALDEKWRQNVLERMKNDKALLGMEKNEPLCTNKVPREGVVLRIDDDPCKEAFKLKCLKFLEKESNDIDAGVYEDMEVEERNQ